jgi:hypothetical protein
MKSLLTLPAILVLSVAATSCGSAGKGVSHGARVVAATTASPGASPGGASNSTSTPHFPGVRQYPGDVDGDNDHNDDEGMRTPGHEADAADLRAIAATVKRYYATAVAGDGARACAMLSSPIVKTVPIEYGRYGAPYLHDDTCAEVLSKLFEHFHRQILTEAARLKVIAARLEGDHGYAALRTRTPCIPGRCVLDTRILTLTKVLVKREGSSWKIESLLAQV